MLVLSLGLRMLLLLLLLVLLCVGGVVPSVRVGELVHLLALMREGVHPTARLARALLLRGEVLLLRMPLLRRLLLLVLLLQRHRRVGRSAAALTRRAGGIAPVALLLALLLLPVLLLLLHLSLGVLLHVELLLSRAGRWQVACRRTDARARVLALTARLRRELVLGGEVLGIALLLELCRVLMLVLGGSVVLLLLQVMECRK